MRILHFCNYADRIGGAEVYAHALIEALRSRGHEVALFGGSTEREVDTPTLRVVQRPLYDATRLVRDAALLSALREYVERFRPEVVHAHNLFSVALEVVDYLGRCGVPLVHTIHDYQLLCPNSWCVRGDGTPCLGGAGAQCFQHECQKNYPYDSWSVLLSALRQQLAASAASLALAPSAHLVERLREHGWPEVRHRPYFIDPPLESGGRARAEYELLYVGRLEREKGVEVLIAAMPAILEAIPRVRLSVIGGGSQESALRRQSEQVGMAAAVNFLTQLPRQELPAHYARATVCILPSVWTENSPLVAYECLASGLPMIGSRIGGIPELIEPDCGFTFGARDPADLARAVIRFLRLPAAERDAFSASARARARSYGKTQHVECIEACCRDALGVHPAPDSRTDLIRELFPILERLGAQLVEGNDPAERSTPLEVLRGIARGLGLPKILKN